MPSWFNEQAKNSVLNIIYTHWKICPKDATAMANSEYPDQTTLLGAVWSGPVMFAKSYLSKK